MELDLDRLTWVCMVCGDERPDAQIAVRHRLLKGMEREFPRARVDLRYCQDRASCSAVAAEQGVWPPAYLVLQADDWLSLTGAAITEQVWQTRRSLLPGMGIGILSWLRDEPSEVSTFLASYDEPAQAVFDMCRALVQQGLVRVVVSRCDPERRLHASPHAGCVLR